MSDALVSLTSERQFPHDLIVPAYQPVSTDFNGLADVPFSREKFALISDIWNRPDIRPG